jgi:hypothetical protein
MPKTLAIYGLDRIGVSGAMEATGEVHFYCSADHAERDAITQGFLASANYSEPQITTDAIAGTVCEWCKKELQDA